jgi:hypothetical protein
MFVALPGAEKIVVSVYQLFQNAWGSHVTGCAPHPYTLSPLPDLKRKLNIN